MNGQTCTDRSSESKQGFNLLRIGWIRAVVLSSLFLYVVQGLMLFVFIWLAVFGWGLFAPEGVESKQFAKTNIVNLLIWAVWWPTMVWVAVLFGRVWCAICPLELVANVTERLGRRVGGKQWVLGNWLRSGFLIVAIYALIQMLVAGVELHRIPAYTSVFLWMMLASAALIGFFFRDRAFCRGFCPVGMLLATYGRGSMLAVRPAGEEACSACPGKDCVRAHNRTRLDSRSCPSLLNPSKLNSSADCLVCGQCIKVCPPSNMGLYLRRPFHPSNVREQLASWPTTLFVILVSGFVSYELCSEWKSAQSAFLSIPNSLTEVTGLTAYRGWIKGTWMLLVFPLLLWLVLGGVLLLCRGAKSLGEGWRRLALPVAVVIAAGHMAKGLAKLVSWGGYLPMALRAPSGALNATAITSGDLARPSALLPMPVVSLVGMTLILIMGCYALRESRLADVPSHRSRVVPILFVVVSGACLAFGWGFLP